MESNCQDGEWGDWEGAALPEHETMESMQSMRADELITRVVRVHKDLPRRFPLGTEKAGQNCGRLCAYLTLSGIFARVIQEANACGKPAEGVATKIERQGLRSVMIGIQTGLSDTPLS